MGKEGSKGISPTMFTRSRVQEGCLLCPGHGKPSRSPCRHFSVPRASLTSPRSRQALPKSQRKFSIFSPKYATSRGLSLALKATQCPELIYRFIRLQSPQPNARIQVVTRAFMRLRPCGELSLTTLKY